MIRASWDAVPFDSRSNVPIQLRIESQSTCRGPELLKKPVTKEQKVPCVFDLYLA
jgi:hypothetical protein